MKNILPFLLAVLLTACSGSRKEPAEQKAAPSSVPVPDEGVTIADQSEPDSLKGSLKAKAAGAIGDARLTIQYHSPAVRGRIIWGGLVPFDRVWVTGAHMATSVEVDKDFRVGDTAVPAGKYAFFTFPGKETWVLVLNTNWQQHLADNYDAQKDVVRWTVKPTSLATPQERLQYTIRPDGEANGQVVMRWEKVEISLPITIDP